MGVRPSSLSAAPVAGDWDDCVGSPRAEEDMLQDYYQQALLSDGLQRIDEWTFIIQDWDETLGILEVSLFFLTRHKLSVIMFSQPGFIMCGLCQQARLVSCLCAIALTDVIGVASISASSRSMPIIFSSSDPFHWLPTHPLFLLPIPQPSVPSFFRSVVHVVLAFKVESGPLSRCPVSRPGLLFAPNSQSY